MVVESLLEKENRNDRHLSKSRLKFEMTDESFVIVMLN